MSFDNIKSKLIEHYNDAGISTMDGVSIFYPDWKLNARASNTEPLLRLNVECIGTNKLEEKISEVRKVTGL
jgi:phosphomannomutase